MAAKIPIVRLGTQGLKVTNLGFGCMDLSSTYNSPVSEQDGISINKDAYTFFDTTDVYGAIANEVLVGKVLGQGDDVVPILGTIKIKNLDDNIGSFFS